MITIKELYEWAVEHNAENLPVGLQYQDSGGCYGGDTYTEYGDEISASILQAEFEQDYVLLE